MADRFHAAVREQMQTGYGEQKALAIVRGRWRAERHREPVPCGACGGRGSVPAADREWPDPPQPLYGRCGACGGSGR